MKKFYLMTTAGLLAMAATPATAQVSLPTEPDPLVAVDVGLSTGALLGDQSVLDAVVEVGGGELLDVYLGLLEGSTVPCPTCRGSGHLRSTESSALVALRGLEREATRGKAKRVRISLPTAVAIYIAKLLTGLRVSPEVEMEGLDLGEHGERAYNY